MVFGMLTSALQLISSRKTNGVTAENSGRVTEFPYHCWNVDADQAAGGLSRYSLGRRDFWE